MADTAPLLGESVVVCCGVPATITIHDDGSFTYKPQQVPPAGVGAAAARGAGSGAARQHGRNAPTRPRRAAQARALARRCMAWCGCCRRPQYDSLHIPGWRVVGAALDSPLSFRVWHYEPQQRGAPAAPHFRLARTAPLHAASGSEAAALVERVRAAAAWRGRDKPPRAVAIIAGGDRGRAEREFEARAAPVLEDAAGLALTRLVSEGPGHAAALAGELNLAAADLLLLVGGDDTVQEAMQGLLGRPDWAAARLLPIAHVPCGAGGGGLAAACGLPDAATAAWAAVKGEVSPMTVASLLQPPGRRRFSCLGSSFGLRCALDLLLPGSRLAAASIAWLPAEQQAAGSSSAAGAGAGAAPWPSGPPEVPGGHDVGGAAGAARQAQQGQQAEPAEPEFASLDHLPPGPDLPLLRQLGGLPLALPDSPSALPPGWQLQHGLALWRLEPHPRGELAGGAACMSWAAGLAGLRGRLAALRLRAAAARGAELGPPCRQFGVRAALLVPRGGSLVLDGQVVSAAPLALEVHPGLLRVILAARRMALAQLKARAAFGSSAAGARPRRAARLACRASAQQPTGPSLLQRAAALAAAGVMAASGPALAAEEGRLLCDAACAAKLEAAAGVTTPSGLTYKDITPGTGPAPITGYQVVVNYVAMTPEGRVFENSLEKQPFDIRVGAGQVIPGLDEGLASMRVGGVRRLYIPGPLAFPKPLKAAPGRCAARRRRRRRRRRGGGGGGGAAPAAAAACPRPTARRAAPRAQADGARELAGRV
ncbi:FKBP16-3 [Scenedesmus sp. PABB004]|nr:FKBP16-3 [Scenedesmus sp. PABB004]